MIPDEFKPLAALVIGAFLLVFLVLMHGAGLHAILVMHKRRVRRLRTGPPHLVRAVILFGSAVFLMLALHMMGFAIWAYSLIYLGLVPRALDALYFSANAYTTLGFGNVDLGEHWRNISPIIGISGLFTFAWTTSALVTVVNAHGELIERLEEEREQEMHMRFRLRKDAWAVLQSERTAERSEKDSATTHAAGASIFQRCRIWKDEKKKVKELRKASLAQMAYLRRKERQDEAAIEPVAPPESPRARS
jgi:voltage-gated potassium channel